MSEYLASEIVRFAARNRNASARRRGRPVRRRRKAIVLCARSAVRSAETSNCRKETSISVAAEQSTTKLSLPLRASQIARWVSSLFGVVKLPHSFSGTQTLEEVIAIAFHPQSTELENKNDLREVNVKFTRPHMTKSFYKCSAKQMGSCTSIVQIVAIVPVFAA